MPAPLAPMDVMRPIAFTDALVRLHESIRADVKVNVNFYGQFFGCGFEGELIRVETLPPDYLAINIVLDGGQGLYLDPHTGTAYEGIGTNNNLWLEFRTSFGASVLIERC